MDECFEKIDQLLTRQGKTQTALISYLGMSRGTYTNWKKGYNRSYRFHMMKIAKFFHVPVSYFGSEFNEEPLSIKDFAILDTLSQDEIQLVNTYRNLSKSRQRLLIDVATEFDMQPKV